MKTQILRVEKAPLTYVNVFGEVVSTKPAKPVKTKKTKAISPDFEGWHGGWRVQGIPPGALQEAYAEHTRLSLGDAPPPPWDEENWLMNAKRRPVRNKPYSIPSAADECRAMAEKAGWLRTEVVELKKEARAKE